MRVSTMGRQGELNQKRQMSVNPFLPVSPVLPCPSPILAGCAPGGIVLCVLRRAARDVADADHLWPGNDCFHLVRRKFSTVTL